jgi:hypothetical protein
MPRLAGWLSTRNEHHASRSMTALDENAARMSFGLRLNMQQLTSSHSTRSNGFRSVDNE